MTEREQELADERNRETAMVVQIVAGLLASGQYTENVGDHEEPRSRLKTQQEEDGSRSLIVVVDATKLFRNIETELSRDRAFFANLEREKKRPH